MSTLYLIFTRINLWHFVWIAVILSVFLSLLLSQLLHGHVVWQYPVSATVIACTIAFLIKRMRTLEQALTEQAGQRVQEALERWQTADALRESQQRFQAFMDHSPSVAFMKDAQGRYVYVNKRWEQRFERAAGDWLGKTDYELWSPETAQQFCKHDEEALAAQAVIERTETTPDPNLGVREWTVSKFPVQDASGNRYLGGVAMDITERIQAEKALYESEARFRAILDNSPNMVFLKDTVGRYLLVNRQFERMFHVSCAEILGKTDDQIFPAEQAAAFQANDCKVLQAGVPMQFEEVALHEDGPHTSIVFKFPLRTMDGKLYGIGGITTDITERKQAEEALRKSEVRYHQLIEASQDAIYMLDDQGTFTLTNPAGCTLLGYTEQELVGMSVVNTYLAEERPAAAERLQQLKMGGPFRFERVAVRKDGTTVPIEVCLSPMTHRRYQAIVHDITERKRGEKALRDSEQQVRQALEARERLSQDLHDHVIQSIYAIGMTLETCQYLFDKDPAGAAGRLQNGIADLNGVLTQLRNYIEWGSLTTIRANRLQEALDGLVRTISSSQSLSIQLHMDSPIVAQLTDDEATHILHIVTEALSNSLRHARAKSGVVSFRRHEGNLRLEVHDDGMGFDTESKEGHGWGLRNMAARASKLGAELKIISKRGNGTRVILDIPRETNHAPEPRESNPAAAG